MSRYSDQLISHLIAYKQKALCIREDGLFRHKSEDLPYSHILPVKDINFNILEEFRSPILNYLGRRRDIKLHKFFHHLNSSQAFAFNLFLPFFIQKTYDPLMTALGLPGDIGEWEPEFVPDPDERTNVDMTWWSPSPESLPTYCEVKLTEREFGPASLKTDEDRAKYDRKMTHFYVPDMQGRRPDTFLERGYFLQHYQIFRNIWLAARDSRATVVFLMPRKNEDLWVQLMPILAALSPDLRNRIRTVAIEDVLTTLKSVAAPSWVAAYADSLQRKYLLPDQPRDP